MFGGVTPIMAKVLNSLLLDCLVICLVVCLLVDQIYCLIRLFFGLAAILHVNTNINKFLYFTMFWSYSTCNSLLIKIFWFFLNLIQSKSKSKFCFIPKNDSGSQIYFFHYYISNVKWETLHTLNTLEHTRYTLSQNFIIISTPRLHCGIVLQNKKK